MVLPAVAAAGRVVAGKAVRSLKTQSKQLNLTGEAPSLILYMIVGIAAILKDASDLLFGFIPVVGTVLALIFGFCFTVTIFLLLALFDRSSGTKSRAMVKRLVVLLFAMVVDVIPIVEFLPTETLSVIVLYLLARSAWRSAKSSESTANNTRQTQLRAQQNRLARMLAIREANAANDSTYIQSEAA
jgi:hypothetical protein